MKSSQFPTLSSNFTVFVRFLSVPTDVREVDACFGMDIDTFRKAVVHEFGATYSDIPTSILFYVRKQARDSVVSVLAKSVEGYMHPGCIVSAYPLPDMESLPLPTYVAGDVERRYLGTSEPRISRGCMRDASIFL